MNRIKLITTEGCYACEIAKNLLEKAVNLVSDPINVEIVDAFDEKTRDFIQEYGLAIGDFPTMIFIRGDKVMSIHTGTMAVPQIIHEIRVYFYGF
jgi:hypothetical protein